MIKRKKLDEEGIDHLIEQINKGKEFEFIKDTCEIFDIEYNMKILDQVFDKYNNIKQNHKTRTAKYIVLKKFYEEVKKLTDSYFNQI
jgi:hypothetical protein